MRVRITLTEPMLGTLPGNKEVATTYVASKRKHPETGDIDLAQDELDEIENMSENLEKSTTFFPRDESGKIHLFDYHFKGFFKAACSALRRVPETRSNKLKAHKKIIDGLIFVGPRKIYIHHTNKEQEFLERPLRANTPQGDRVALARSEMVPAGSYMDIDVLCLDPKLEPYVIEWLEYGGLKGLCQWRNGGYGRFEYKQLDAPKKAKKTKK